MTDAKTELINCPYCQKSKTIYKKYTCNQFAVYYCKKCQIGFTFPIPKNISSYYHSKYWKANNYLGKTKLFIFKIFQKRRITWINSFCKKGEILEIGAGEGDFQKLLGNNFSVTCIESPKAKIKNNNVLKVDFFNWKTNKKFDAIIFWESLEHLENPKNYLKKANQLLKKGGLVFIEFPRFDSLEAKFFGKYWFHLDIPRHLTHFSNSGLKLMLKNAGFKTISQKGVLALEYTIWGHIASLLAVFNINSTDYLKKSGNIFFILLLAPAIFLSIIFEIIQILLNQQPIWLTIAENNGKKT